MLFSFTDTATTEIYTLSLHDALPILQRIEQETGGLNADVGKLRVEKWKVDSSTKHQASENIGSIQRNVTAALPALIAADRKSTRLNSSHVSISYAVFCLKKKKKKNST